MNKDPPPAATNKNPRQLDLFEQLEDNAGSPGHTKANPSTRHRLEPSDLSDGRALTEHNQKSARG